MALARKAHFLHGAGALLKFAGPFRRSQFEVLVEQGEIDPIFL